jgi:hypothetical protein
MRALTVCQPFAWGIIHGPKTVENREWPVPATSPVPFTLVIHAGLSRSYVDALLADGTEPPPEKELVFGALIGTVQVVECLPVGRVRGRRYTRHAEGPWCWLLADPLPIRKPIPVRGKLGLWNVPDELLPALRAQLR